MVEKILARLAGKSGWNTSIPAPDYNSITVSDIAYCLSGLSYQATLYGWAKYIGGSAIHRINLLKWLKENTKRTKYSDRMAELAIEETLKPRHCPACRGRHEVVTKGGLKALCRRCSGIGTIPWTKSERARYCGMSRTTWNDWNDKYERMYQQLDMLDWEIKRNVRRKLG